MEDTKPLVLKSSKAEANGNFNNIDKLPESPKLPMEFLSRSWSLSALQLSKSLSHSLSPLVINSRNGGGGSVSPSILEEETYGAAEEDRTQPHAHELLLDHNNNSSNKQRINPYLAGNSFSFASNTTSQLILERIMSQSDVSPLTSGRPSCSEPLSMSGGGQSCNSLSADQLPLDSPSFSPPHHDFDYKFLASYNTPHIPLPPHRVVSKTGTSTPVGGGGSSKTVGRWLKERKEKKKEELRVHNAQLHAAVSVAAVAAAVAAAAAATASASSSTAGSSGKDEQAVLTDAAMASAATLVAARCVEAAESLGADRDHLASVLGSAVNVQSHGDIMTLTAAAATALRGAATLKARAMREVCSIAAVLPLAVERSLGLKGEKNNSCLSSSYNFEPFEADDGAVGSCNESLLARGSELLKRTRKGGLHWKIVSVYINKDNQVTLKMKSRHVAGTLTKRKKKLLMDVCKNMPAWPERYHVNYGQEKRYFGLKTVTNRVIQFECKDQTEHDFWTQGVLKLLSMASENKSKLNLRNFSFGSR